MLLPDIRTIPPDTGAAVRMRERARKDEGEDWSPGHFRVYMGLVTARRDELVANAQAAMAHAARDGADGIPSATP